jgi:hypothetical protein
LAAGLSGCGGNKFASVGAVPVKGQVLLPSGKPLSSGKVVFLPQGEGMPATGVIGSDGAFTLKTADGRDGAVPGQYKVRLEPSQSAVSNKGGRLDPRSLPFPAHYMDEDGDTGLTATVTAGTTQLSPFRLAEKPAGRPVSKD